MNTIDSKELKELFETTQKGFPPHYPTKMHGVSREVQLLINNLKTIIDYLGFENANIAIKYIIGKTINEFLTVTFEKNKYENGKNCDFEVVDKNISNGKKTIISYKNMSLELKYLDNGIITIRNNSLCEAAMIGEDYSKTTILYDVNKPNNLYLAQTLDNNSVLQSTCTFDESGIEMEKKFKIIVSEARNKFIASHQCVVGSITRNDDFYTATYRMKLVGRDFSNLISKKDIEIVNSTPEITVPIKSMNSLENDINLLYVLTRELKQHPIGGYTGTLSILLYNYYDHYDYAKNNPERYERDYEDSRKIIKFNECIEMAYNSWDIITPRIYVPYSSQILKNVKEYVYKRDSSLNEKKD